MCPAVLHIKDVSGWIIVDSEFPKKAGGEGKSIDEVLTGEIMCLLPQLF